MSTAFLDRLRQPEYTGNNRCLPCTAVNLAIAAVVSMMVVAVAGQVLDVVIAAVFGTLCLLACVLAISLRGYLIPGTPELTRRYLPVSILGWFDKEVREVETGEIDVEATLGKAGIIEECETIDDLCLSAAFRSEWTERMRTLQRKDTGREDLASIFDVDPDHITFNTYNEAFVGYFEGQKVGQWESHAAYLADMAAVQPLRSRIQTWATMEIGERGALLRGLRVFLDTCPACGGDVDIDHRVVDSCCHSTDVTTLSCQECDARLFEAKQLAA